MKYLFALALLLAIGTNASGLVLDEKNITELGFNPIALSSNALPHCETLSFAPAPEYAEEGHDTLLRLHLNFIPVFEADANVSVYVNGDTAPMVTFYPKDRHPDTGYVSVILPPEQLTTPETTLQLCATPSASTEKMEIDAGTIGLYQQARFDENGSFATIVAGNDHPILGEEIPITVVLTNQGGESVFVDVDYRKYELEYVPLLKGETGFQATILPGQTHTITYRIKPLRSVSILLPPAILTYTNIFGETIVQESERAFLSVAAPEFNVKGAFLVPQNRVSLKESMAVEWVVQNEGIAPLTGIEARFFVRPEGTITPASAYLESLSPSDVESRTFTVSFSTPGVYELGCTLSPTEDPSLTASCQSVTIEAVEDGAGIALLFSILLLLIAVGVYAYIYILPTPLTKEEPPKRGRFHSL